ncbi:MAG: hypothetical protein QF824_05135 [Candidatus Woesearchaeota archaeon]|jgi:hypothetical protein|nr:hypothetical protein [Candidatus Woesearchaeota archaeon]MDP7180628.1 hypothetical protein [Candidatus Woesearchaeota archaeon]MDP7458437.1 hypothetical protein [Candidatus Woesearchaeota archaeon]|tara:strand:+ start:81 stop:428 length:348 start_codon:yes stop_codon:yes gene_type:complete
MATQQPLDMNVMGQRMIEIGPVPEERMRGFVDELEPILHSVRITVRQGEDGIPVAQDHFPYQFASAGTSGDGSRDYTFMLPYRPVPEGVSDEDVKAVQDREDGIIVALYGIVQGR